MWMHSQDVHTETALMPRVECEHLKLIKWVFLHLTAPASFPPPPSSSLSPSPMFQPDRLSILVLGRGGGRWESSTFQTQILGGALGWPGEPKRMETCDISLMRWALNTFYLVFMFVLGIGFSHWRRFWCKMVKPVFKSPSVFWLSLSAFNFCNSREEFSFWTYSIYICSPHSDSSCVPVLSLSLPVPSSAGETPAVSGLTAQPPGFYGFPWSPLGCCVFLFYCLGLHPLHLSSHIHFINWKQFRIPCLLAIRTRALIMTPSLFIVSFFSITFHNKPSRLMTKTFPSSYRILITTQNHNKTMTTILAYVDWVLTMYQVLFDVFYRYDLFWP